MKSALCARQLLLPGSVQLKDGHSYEVNRPLYDANLARLRETINQAKIGVFEETKALQSLAEFTARLV